MLKSQILESLIGEKVTITCLDRNESTYHGELMEAGELGIVIKHLNHGREFIEFIPSGNVNSLSHKVLGSN